MQRRKRNVTRSFVMKTALPRQKICHTASIPYTRLLDGTGVSFLFHVKINWLGIQNVAIRSLHLNKRISLAVF